VNNCQGVPVSGFAYQRIATIKAVFFEYRCVYFEVTDWPGGKSFAKILEENSQETKPTAKGKLCFDPLYWRWKK